MIRERDIIIDLLDLNDDEIKQPYLIFKPLDCILNY